MASKRRLNERARYKYAREYMTRQQLCRALTKLLIATQTVCTQQMDLTIEPSPSGPDAEAQEACKDMGSQQNHVLPSTALS